MVEVNQFFKEFKIQSVSEFFRRNVVMFGYMGKVCLLMIFVYEVVINFFDVCEEVGILFYVRVEIEEFGNEYYKVVVEDNGFGILEKYIIYVFGKMFVGIKVYRNIQSCGQQGIGISGVVMFVQIMSGKVICVIILIGNDEIIEVWVKIDVDKNEGKIVKKEKYLNLKGWCGMRIEFEVKNVKYMCFKQGVFWYFKLMVIVNFYVYIEFIELDGKFIVFLRLSDYILELLVEMKFYLKGVFIDDVYRLVKKMRRNIVRRFFIGEFLRISDKKVDEFIEYIVVFRLIKIVEDKKFQEQYYQKFMEGYVKVVFRVFKGYIKVVKQVVKMMEKLFEKFIWYEVEEIVEVFKYMKFLVFLIYGLRFIGEENIEKGFKGIFKLEFVIVVIRLLKVYLGGILFQVEVGIVYGGEILVGFDFYCYVNRVLFLFDVGLCVIIQVVCFIDWKCYKIDDFDRVLFVFMINVVLVYVFYIGIGKQSIVSVDEIYNEICLVIMDVVRRFQIYLSGKYRKLVQVKRRKIFEKYVFEIVRVLSILMGEFEEKIREYFIRFIESKFVSVEVEEVVVEEVVENV